MAVKRNLIYYLILNTVIPGLGQLFLGKWIRGVLLIAASLACFMGAFLIMAMPMWHNFQMLLDDERGEMQTINLVHFAAAFLALLLVWVWSIADAAFCLRTTAPGRSSREDSSVEENHV